MTTTQQPVWTDAYGGDDPIQPYRGNPQLGNLATPINSSGLVKTYIKQPARLPSRPIPPFCGGWKSAWPTAISWWGLRWSSVLYEKPPTGPISAD